MIYIYMTNDILNDDILDDFKVIEERNAKLVLENKKLKGEMDRLRHEKYLMYKDLVKMKNNIEDYFNYIGKNYFADDFYEE